MNFYHIDDYFVYFCAMFTQFIYVMVDLKDLFNYDFSGKRVRFLGKCMTKFDIAYHIDDIKYQCATVYCDAFSYDEMKMKLYRLLLYYNMPY